MSKLFKCLEIVIVYEVGNSTETDVLTTEGFKPRKDSIKDYEEAGYFPQAFESVEEAISLANSMTAIWLSQEKYSNSGEVMVDELTYKIHQKTHELYDECIKTLWCSTYEQE